MREVRKSIYNVSRPNHFGSIKKMPIDMDIGEKRAEAQAGLSYQDVYNKVKQYEQSTITPALEQLIMGIPKDKQWSLEKEGFQIIVEQTPHYAMEQNSTQPKILTGSTIPAYWVSTKDLEIEGTRLSVAGEPNPVDENLTKAFKAFQQVYKEAGFQVRIPNNNTSESMMMHITKPIQR